jgi:hypothetical protein
MSLTEKIAFALFKAGIAAGESIANGGGLDDALAASIESLASERAKARFPDLVEDP